ncbi:MAG: potassium/proton antiporter [Candidatus Omnitrophica bacterium]|nr:potassium/proton antiporter [Candidatus Omnitrophota bacterium]MDD5553713.1 potassium/proton antiporter [Candidatus Omnitrophota bacterium]
MMAIETIILWAAILTLVSVLASKLSDRFALPALLLFLIIGMLAGSEGLGGIYFDDYSIAKSIGLIALIFIIFSGGLDTSWKSVKPLFIPGLVLSTAGVLITAIIVGIFAVVILKFSLLEGLLLGSIVSSTDAAAVFTVLRSRRIALKGNLRPLLELESGSNDPMAVFLTIGCIGLLTTANSSVVSLIPAFAVNMGVGLLSGYLMSKASVILINKIKLEYEGLYSVLTIALVLLTYAVTTLMKGNGFLAVYLLGLMMSRNDFVNKRTIVRFYEGIAWIMQIAMFLTLGLLVFPSQIIPIIGVGLLIAAILIFLARPISVFLCLMPFKFNLVEKTMISWVGLRGAVPIILASFPLLAGIAQAHSIFNIVFFVVLTSVLIQGTSIPFMSKILGVNVPLDVRKKYPIEFEYAEGIDASLTDMIVPYNSDAVGKTIAAINIPPKALIVLISREDKFIVPNGSTVIEEGDVFLVLANAEDFSTLHQTMAKIRKEGA